MLGIFYTCKLNKSFKLAKEHVKSALPSLYKSQGLNKAAQTPWLERLLGSYLSDTWWERQQLKNWDMYILFILKEKEAITFKIWKWKISLLGTSMLGFNDSDS